MVNDYIQKVPIQLDEKGNPFIVLNLSNLIQPMQELLLMNSNEIKHLIEDNVRIRTDLRGLDVKQLHLNHNRIMELLDKLMTGLTVKIS